jgi:ABC-type sugar transport system permease subunit
MDSFESDRIARGRAKVTNGNYDRWDSDVRSYLDYEQKQINRQENLDSESRKRDEENRRQDLKHHAHQHKIDRENEIQEADKIYEIKSKGHFEFVRNCEKDLIEENNLDVLYQKYENLIRSTTETHLWNDGHMSELKNIADQISSKINSIDPSYLPSRRATFAKYEKERNEKYLKEKAELKSEKISRFITVTLSKVALTIFLGFCLSFFVNGVQESSKNGKGESALSYIILIIPTGSALLASIFWIFIYDEKKD